MSKNLLTISFGIACAAVAIAQPPNPEFPMISPTAVEVAGVNADAGVLEFAVTVMVPVTKNIQVERKVLVDGQERTVVETRTVTAYESMVKSVQWALKGNRAFDGNGKKLEGDAFWKKIKKGDVVLMAQGTTIDAKWTKVLKPETIILLSEPAAHPALPKPPPPPATRLPMRSGS